MHCATHGFGQRGEEQVRANRRRGMEAEQQDEQRRHQRSAPNASQPDKNADQPTGKRIKRINVQRCDPCFPGAIAGQVRTKSKRLLCRPRFNFRRHT
jgi:hypothetical protein